jgi:hypothetical protein
MSRQLPYPGHTWSLSQHAVGINPKTLYDFLKCVAPFEGQSSDYAENITALMIASGVLTPNERDGQLDAWRDYQQILAELGLIYSTKTVHALTLTELGHMFLSGELGFAELIGAQALRYQYPNGQKSTIQYRLRNMLESASIAVPKTLIELQANLGILLKPGSLILRVLLELLNAGHNPVLTVSECQAFLLPCKTNSEWTAALLEIVAHRKSGSNIDRINRHSRRNIQDWFKLLEKSDFFELDDEKSIKLSSYALDDIESISEYVCMQEDAGTFWIPVDFEERKGWFDWFGHMSYEMQRTLRSDLENEEDYVAENYIGGEEDAEDELGSLETLGVNLSAIDLEHLGRDTQFIASTDIEALVANLRKGAQKRHAKTLLHDRIIRELAVAYIAQGATVESDPNSIDLYALWPDGNSAIFEVKTVTRRSLQGRLRSAIGQVEEYAYRRQIAGASPSDKVVVINTDLPSDAWQKDFLTQHMGIGLICKCPKSYQGYAPDAFPSKIHWIS